jgi:hypothetical protein
MKTYQLFMGRNIPNGDIVTNKEWQEFINVLDTVFDGYTISEVDGVWKGEHERTECVTVCTKYEDDVMYVANKYKDAFMQDAVAIQQLPAMEFV